MHVNVIQDDVLDSNTDCLVAPAGENLEMSSSVARKLREECGGPIYSDLQRYSDPEPGSALVTDGYGIAEHILHAVTTPDGRTRGQNVRQATREALEMADRLGGRSLAMPLLGAGVGGLQPSTATKIIGETIDAFSPTYLSEATIVCLQESRYQTATTLCGQDETPWVDRTQSD